MIWLFSDYLTRSGGIESYLHALSCHLQQEEVPFALAVCEMDYCDMLAELEHRGIRIYRQRKVPGDRWNMRQRLLTHWLLMRLEPDDWVFCVRQPREEIYEKLVVGAHSRGARVAASWMVTPDVLEVKPSYRGSFCRAVQATDAVISVSHAGAGMYERAYGFTGKVHVVPYHNLPLFPEPLALPTGPPWRFGYIGRIEESQKNLGALVDAFGKLAQKHHDVTLDFHGSGPDQEALQDRVSSMGMNDVVRFHGRYDHRRDLGRILEGLHCVVYTSRYEGGPCFSLLEAMQAGRYVLATRVGGIPDLYEGHPEAGHLIEGCTAGEICEGLEDVRHALSAGRISIHGPRSRYVVGFTMRHAHEAFLHALSLSQHHQSR
jgi:glycosyltransferase involved in cell wall biosynthesis